MTKGVFQPAHSYSVFEKLETVRTFEIGRLVRAARDPGSHCSDRKSTSTENEWSGECDTHDSGRLQQRPGAKTKGRSRGVGE